MTTVQDAEIRQAQTDDIEAIVELWKEFMDFHRSRDGFFTLAADAEQRFSNYMRSNIKSPDWLVLVATVEEIAVGYCMATILEYPPVFELKRHGFVQDIAVTASHRRQGLGRRLFEEAAVWLRARGVQRIELQVSAANEVSQGFWRAMGFRIYLHRLERSESGLAAP